MKKLLVAIMLVGMLLSANVSYGKDQQQDQNQRQDQQQDQSQGQNQTSINANINENSIRNNVDVDNKNTNTNINGNNNRNDNVNSNENSNSNENNSSATNHGNSVSIVDVNPSQLLSPDMVAPLYKTQYDDLTMTTSIFKLQRADYTVAELTRFANPGRFLAILWPEWDNTYQVEVATFVKAKSVKQIQVGVASDFVATNMTKIGEAHAFSKSLHKSEHQVMAAMAVKAAEAGARLIVFRTFSNPVTKVDSMVIGGAGAQTASSTSVFNGATGIGSSTGEKLSRAYVVAELYR